MKKSEKILAGITAAAVVGYLLLSFTGGGDTGESTGATSEEVAQLHDEYNQRIGQIKLAETISKQYFDIVGQSSSMAVPVEGVPFRPDLDFLNEVEIWCKDEGFQNPKFDSKSDPIKNVDDYRLVNITIQIDDARLPGIAKLLKKFEANGLILKEVDISSRTDHEEIDAEIVIGKIVPNYIKGDL